ncbi:unnamed protein product [Pleuronectes platessa]|uniref:Transposable element P transposase-like RNase H C-terminal domain-containing protein n=1 Tax=Pleuronectes platessa TaxID=8262 RepID=A0A9N7YUH6_PLEPL|nr:unnamed protein product [Pleuronectes platessa]
MSSLAAILPQAGFLEGSVVPEVGFLSVLGYIINIDTLLAMVPVLIEGQRYVLTYRFSHDHLELLFNSIRALGGWNNNPNASQLLNHAEAM